MSVPTQVIELPHDVSLAAIQGQLAKARAKRVLLVLAGGSQVLANPARLRLIHRQGLRQGVQVALVTNDYPTRRLARRAGFPVFSRVRGSRHAGAPARVGHRRKGRPQSLTRRDPPLLPDRNLSRWSRWSEALRLLLFLLISLAGLAALLLFVVPVATVTLVAPRQPVTVSVPVVAAVGVEEVDYQAGQIPARVVQTRVEGNGTIATTGRRNAPADHATGKVLFINRRESEVQVPELTVVRTSTGINVSFQVTQAITVPAGIGQTMEAGVEAEEPGPEGNVPAFTVNRVQGPLSLAVGVINELPTEGGSFQEVGLVTETDKDLLRDRLLQEVRQQSYQRLGDMLREGESVPPDTVDTVVMAETFDRFSGEDSEVLGLRLELLARGLAVDARSADEMAARALREQIPEGVHLLGDELSHEHGAMTVLDEELGRIGFTVKASAITVGTVDGAAVRMAIRTMTIPDALATLRRDFELGAEPEVTLRPDWLGLVPWLPLRIHVRVLEE